MSEIRYSVLFDEYVIIAPERLHKPVETEEKTELPDISKCPFCPGNEDKLQKEIFSIRKDSRWLTKVIPNLYRAVQIETPFEGKREGMFESFGGFGAHEVIIDTPNHYTALSQMKEEEYFYWLQTVKERVSDLAKDKRLIMANVYKNHGIKAGASQTHPHSQIIALPLMSVHQKRMFERMYGYYKKHGRALMNDVITNEKLLIDTGDFAVFNPYASYFAFETIIASKNLCDIRECGEKELLGLASLFYRTVKALSEEIGNFEGNFIFYLSMLNKNFENEEYFDEAAEFFRFFIRITPRIYPLAGFEVGTLSRINPLSPETAYKLLKEKI